MVCFHLHLGEKSLLLVKCTICMGAQLVECSTMLY